MGCKGRTFTPFCNLVIVSTSSGAIPHLLRKTTQVTPSVHGGVVNDPLYTNKSVESKSASIVIAISMSNRIPGPRPSAPALVTKGCNRLLIHSVDSSARFANTATTNVCVVGLSVLLPVALLPSSAFAGGTTPISDEGNVEDSDD